LRRVRDRLWRAINNRGVAWKILADIVLTQFWSRPRLQRPDSVAKTCYGLCHRIRSESRMSDIPSWHIVGDWFDNCSCAVPCPCTFAQALDNGFCESVLFWHVNEGHYGDGRRLSRHSRSL
jgi:hypothetical protein